MYAECYVKHARRMGVAGVVSRSAREGNNTIEQKTQEGTPNQPEVSSSEHICRKASMIKEGFTDCFLGVTNSFLRIRNAMRSFSFSEGTPVSPS